MGSALQPVVQPASSPVGPAVLSPLGVAERQSMPNHVEPRCTQSMLYLDRRTNFSLSLKFIEIFILEFFTEEDR